jgi:hypothetical protein
LHLCSRRATNARPRRLTVAWRRSTLALSAAATAAAIAVVIAHGLNSGGSLPQQFATVVSGTYLALGAHGSATPSKARAGWRIELNATGLSRLDNGRYYEAWLKNTKRDPGARPERFNDASNVTLWSGAPGTELRTLTVTRQEANGNPASSRWRVLAGTIAAPR